MRWATATWRGPRRTAAGTYFAAGGFPMASNKLTLTRFGIDDGPHNMDGLRLLARNGKEQVEAFIGRKVMDVWVESIERRGGRQSLFRDQYNALGKRTLEAIERIGSGK